MSLWRALLLWGEGRWTPVHGTGVFAIALASVAGLALAVASLAVVLPLGVQQLAFAWTLARGCYGLGCRVLDEPLETRDYHRVGPRVGRGEYRGASPRMLLP